MYKTQELNKQLVFENVILKSNIQDLQRKLDILEMKEIGSITGAMALKAEDDQIARKIDRNKRTRRTRELTAIFEQDIKRLKEKNRILEKKLEEDTYEAQKRSLIQRKKMGLKNLARREKRYQSLIAQSKDSLRVIKFLRVENGGLKQDLNMAKTGP